MKNLETEREGNYVKHLFAAAFPIPLTFLSECTDPTGLSGIQHDRSLSN